VHIIRSNKAVSSVLGMVLILGTVVTAVGLIYTFGMPKIESAKESAQMENMRSNFLVLQTDIKDIVQSPSTGRVTKMHLETGSMYLHGENDSVNSSTGYLEYNAKGKIIAYENGAVFAKYPRQEYAEVVGDPIMYVDLDTSTDPDFTNVYIHCIKLTGNKSIAGTGPVTFALDQVNHTKAYENTPMTNVTFNINSTFYRGWYDYFERILTDAGLDEGAAGAADYNITTQNETVIVFIDGKNHTVAEHDVLLYAVETEVSVS
jgi:hypothetical protein